MYFGIVVYFLRAASPVSFCAYCGPSPSFWWGDRPTPGPHEYFRNKAYYDLLFTTPYLVAGFILTVCGCAVAQPLAQRLRTSVSRPMIASSVATCALTLLAAATSDAGSLLGLWQAPLFLLHGSYSPYLLIVVLPKVFLPAAILSGLLALASAKRFL